ncbi:UNVERIFIED_CONTAM: hypothetical protein FKN15_035869 [Acipenser sinensis]
MVLYLQLFSCSLLQIPGAVSSTPFLQPFTDSWCCIFCSLPAAFYRFLVLFFNCLLTFGSYFCFDIPSVLQDQFQGVIVQNRITAFWFKGKELALAFGLTLAFSRLGSVLNFFLTQRVEAHFGIQWTLWGVGVFLFSFLTVLGSAVFALGSHFKGTAFLLPLMLTDRLIFGSGNGSLTIVQNRITAFWFKGKELALAFGLTLAFSRLGSVLNFFLTQRVEAHFGIQWTLWGGERGSEFISEEGYYFNV